MNVRAAHSRLKEEVGAGDRHMQLHKMSLVEGAGGWVTDERSLVAKIVSVTVSVVGEKEVPDEEMVVRMVDAAGVGSI